MSETAAIWVLRDDKVSIIATGTGNSFLWVRRGKIRFFSCYLTLNQIAASYHQIGDSLEDVIFLAPESLVVVDFNVRVVELGMPQTNMREWFILEMSARAGLNILNICKVTTVWRPGYGETIPDFSLASENVTSRFTDWHFVKVSTTSDHQDSFSCDTPEHNSHT